MLPTVSPQAGTIIILAFFSGAVILIIRTVQAASSFIIGS